MVLEPGEVPVVRQRVAVYAVVRSERGVLLAQNSARTNAAGTWGLAGGGLDLGELPEAALHREIWEETGQRVDITGIAGGDDAALGRPRPEPAAGGLPRGSAGLPRGVS